jgi:hypothetical protein
MADEEIKSFLRSNPEDESIRSFLLERPDNDRDIKSFLNAPTPPQRAPVAEPGPSPKRPIGATVEFEPGADIEKAFAGIPEIGQRLISASSAAMTEFVRGATLDIVDPVDFIPELEAINRRFEKNIPIDEDDPLLDRIAKRIEKDPNILAKVPARLTGELLTIGGISRRITKLRGIPKTTKELMKNAAITGAATGLIADPGERETAVEVAGAKAKAAATNAILFAGVSGVTAKVLKAIDVWRAGKPKALAELREEIYKLFIDKQGLPRNAETIRWADDALNEMAAGRGGLAKINRFRVRAATRKVKEASDQFIKSGETPPPRAPIAELPGPKPEIPVEPVPPPRAPRPKPTKEFNIDTDSLSDFVRKRGGLSTKGAMRGELVAKFSIKEGFNLLNNKTGLAPDRMREAAQESGFPGLETPDDLLTQLEADVLAKKQKIDARRIFHPGKTFTDDELIADAEYQMLLEESALAARDYSLEIDPTVEPISPKQFQDQPPPTPQEEINLKSIIANETGGINLEPLADLTLDGLKKANKVIEKLDVYHGVPDEVAEQFVKFNQHYNTVSKESAAKRSFDTFKNFSDEQIDFLQNTFEAQKISPLRDDVIPLADKIVEIQEDHFRRKKALGVDVERWPDNVILKNQETIDKLNKKLKELQISKPGVKGAKQRQPLINKRDQIIQTNRELANLSYLSRFTFDPKLKRLGFGKRGLITRPKEFFGRVFPTVQAARKAGKEVLRLPEIIARAEEILLKTEQTHALVNAMMRNPAFSVPASRKKKNPETYGDWELLPQDVLPASRKRFNPAVGRMVGEDQYFHPTIARLLREVTFSKKPNIWWKINNAMTSLIFYNPGIMTTNDVMQSLMFMGPRALNPLRLTKAFKTVASHHKDFWVKLGPAMDKYLKLTPEMAERYKIYQDTGIYNKGISSGQQAEDIARNMIEAFRATLPQELANTAASILKNPIKSLRKFNDNTTWIIDEVLRTMAMDYALESGFFDKDGLSTFQRAREVNFALGWYESTPRETRRVFRQTGFTLTFMNAMLKREARNYRHALKLAQKEFFGKEVTVPVPGRLFEQFVWQTFLKMFYRYGLPAAILEYFRREGYQNAKTWVENQYRIVVQGVTAPEVSFKDGKKKLVPTELIITPGGPVVLTNKLLGRPVPLTMFYQLAPALSALGTFVFGPKFKRFAEENDITDTIDLYIKFGTPLKRDILLWMEKDRSNASKFLQQMGWWFHYTRKAKKTPREVKQEAHWMKEMLQTLGLMPSEILLRGVPGMGEERGRPRKLKRGRRV